MSTYKKYLFRYYCHFKNDFFSQILTKRLKHSIDKHKDLQMDYDELKLTSEKVNIPGSSFAGIGSGFCFQYKNCFTYLSCKIHRKGYQKEIYPANTRENKKNMTIRTIRFCVPRYV